MVEPVVCSALLPDSISSDVPPASSFLYHSLKTRKKVFAKQEKSGIIFNRFKASEGKASEGKASEGKASEGKASEGKASEGKASEGKRTVCTRGEKKSGN